MCSDPKLLAIVRSKCMGVRACELQIHSCNHIPNQCHQGFEVFLSRMCCSDQTVLVALGTIFVHFRFKVCTIFVHFRFKLCAYYFCAF